MGLDFFPSKMKSVRSSKHATQLKIIRFVSLGVLALLLILNIIIGLFNIFSISTWTLLYALLFEAFAVLSYFVHEVDKVASILYLLAWSFNAVMIWLFIYLSISLGSLLGSSYNLIELLNYLPFIILLVDFIYNKISFVRLQYVIPIALNLIDFFFWYEEFEVLTIFLSTLQGILLRVVFIVGIVGVLELSRLIKVRSCKEDEKTHSLL